MKSMLNTFILATLVLIFCAISMRPTATAQPAHKPLSTVDSKQQIMELEKSWAEAEDKHDAATLTRVLDAKFVATFGVKEPYDKQKFIDSQVIGAVDPTASQTLDESVILDGDTAIAIGTDTARGTKNGKPYKEVYPYTVTYIRRHGQWLALAEHLAK